MKELIALISMIVPSGNDADDKLRVLMYHKVVPDMTDRLNRSIYQDVASFDTHLKYLRDKNYRIISAEELLSIVKDKQAFPKKSVLLTFDDGSVDNYQYAFPVLKKHNAPALIFLTAGFIGTDKAFWWDRVEESLIRTNKSSLILIDCGREKTLPLHTVKDRINAYIVIDKMIKNNMTDSGPVVEKICQSLGVSDEPKRRSALSWEEIKEMSGSNITFGAHTTNHFKLCGLSIGDSVIEIKGSKEILERELGKKIETFAYPYGGREDYSADNANIVKESGILLAFTTVSGLVERSDDLFKLKRIPVSGVEGAVMLKARLSGNYFKIIEKIKGK